MLGMPVRPAAQSANAKHRSILKDEIARVARKEMRSESVALKKASTSHRAEIAALKRRVLAAEQQLKRLLKVERKPSSSDVEEPPARGRRFSAKGLASQRKRLGLSAEDIGLLVGDSSQSVYNWEHGIVRPRAARLAAITTLKTLGKNSASATLEERRKSS